MRSSQGLLRGRVLSGVSNTSRRHLSSVLLPSCVAAFEAMLPTLASHHLPDLTCCTTAHTFACACASLAVIAAPVSEQTLQCAWQMYPPYEESSLQCPCDHLHPADRRPELPSYDRPRRGTEGDGNSNLMSCQRTDCRHEHLRSQPRLPCH